MQSVRNSLEYPKGGGPQGTTRFDANRMRPVVIKDGVAVQDATTGNVTAAAGAYQALASDGVILATTAGNQTVTLPAVADVPKGHVVQIKKAGNSGTLTIEGSGSETVDNAANLTTTTLYDTITVVSDGAEWWSVGYAAAVTGTNRVLTTTAQTTTATVAITDDVTIDSGTSDHTLTLPTAVGNDGAVLYFKKTGVSGVITVDGDSAETIDGAANFTLTEQYESAAIISNGTAWFRLDNTPKLLVQSITTTDTVLPNTDVVLITAEAGTYNIALPTPALRGAGKTLVIKKATATGANAQTLTTPGAETIDGASSLDITAAYRTVTLLSDGTNWHMISNHTPAAG